MRMAGKIFSGDGSEALFGNMLNNFKNEVDLGLSTYDAQVEMEANEIWDKYLKKAQKKKEGSGWSKVLGTVGKVAGTVGTIASLFCDERVKNDISQLQVRVVDDALSQMAFAVWAIRERVIGIQRQSIQTKNHWIRRSCVILCPQVATVFPDAVFEEDGIRKKPYIRRRKSRTRK